MGQKEPKPIGLGPSGPIDVAYSRTRSCFHFFSVMSTKILGFFQRPFAQIHLPTNWKRSINILWRTTVRRREENLPRTMHTQFYCYHKFRNREYIRSIEGESRRSSRGGNSPSRSAWGWLGWSSWGLLVLVLHPLRSGRSPEPSLPLCASTCIRSWDKVYLSLGLKGDFDL